MRAWTGPAILGFGFRPFFLAAGLWAALAMALRWPGIRHIFSRFARPCTPKTNGKTQRFIQTFLREWAYGLAHPTSAARNADRPGRLDGFNRARPHSAFKGLPRSMLRTR
ncbi:integrase core domain-containing protein [Rubellimicrobium thermophilum]